MKIKNRNEFKKFISDEEIKWCFKADTEEEFMRRFNLLVYKVRDVYDTILLLRYLERKYNEQTSQPNYNSNRQI